MLRDLERILKAVADVTRLRILRMLEGGPLCVCQIVEVLGLSQSTVSKHLLLLKHAGLIEDERRGKWTFYRRTPGLEGSLQGAMRVLLTEFLTGEPRVAEDLRRSRLPRVKKMTACCPPGVPKARGPARALQRARRILSERQGEDAE